MQEAIYTKVIDLIKVRGDRLVAEAGQIKDIGVKKKFLTQEDLSIESALSDLITNSIPNAKVYAEELHDSFEEAEDVFVIDPISNTQGFIAGWPHYAVVLSHLQKGETVFACVYLPALNELFTAYKGGGAFLNDKRISVSDRGDGHYGLFAPRERSPFTMEQSAKLIETLGEKYFFMNIGSLASHYAYVACGCADIAISLNKDTFPEFAGQLLVQEAGGVMSDFNGDELRYDTRGVVASRADLHGELLEGIRLVLDD